VFFQNVEQCVDFQPPVGQQESFTRALSPLPTSQPFFVEWRMRTNGNRSEIPGTAPSSMVVASSSTGVNYHFTIAADRVRFIRDNFVPTIWLDLSPANVHTFRLELDSAMAYVWYTDDVLTDSGVPEGPLASGDGVIQWRAKSWMLPSTTEWDYIRFGTIPQPASGDFDSSGVVDANDAYFFIDCLLGPDAAGPGCRWADMNTDLAVNGEDVQLFAAALLAP